MTHYIGILNSKGGVGKTTTAIHLAQALVPQHSVELWDADPQGSATDWAYTTEEHGQPLPFPVASVNHREISRKTTEADFVLIDTPPGNSQVLDAAANRSTMLIIPTKPASLDMARVWATLDSIPATLPAIVLLTHANPRTISYQQAIEALDQAQIAVFDTPIKNLETIKNNANTYPKDLAGYEQVAAELLNLIGDES